MTSLIFSGRRLIKLMNILFNDYMVTDRFLCANGCGRSYKYKKGLDRHLQFECGVEPQFECIVCGKMFKQRCYVKTHSVNIHNIIIID